MRPFLSFRASFLLLLALIALAPAGCQSTDASAAPRATPKVAPAPRAAAAVIPPAATNDPRYQVALGTLPPRGPEDARVTIIEFLDYQCPFCAHAQATVAKLAEAYPNELRVVVRQMPLPFHPRARLMAQAAVAAARQGKFWEMHEVMFRAPGGLDRDGLVAAARTVGLDVPTFERALDAPDVAAEVDADVAAAGKFGVKGTPSFFLNGRLVRGAQPGPVFEKIVAEELVAADQVIARGAAPKHVYEALTANGLTAAAPEPAEDGGACPGGCGAEGCNGHCAGCDHAANAGAAGDEGCPCQGHNE